MKNPEKAEIKKILEHAKTIAVVGLSDKSYRTSHQIAEAMQASGYKIIPVNPYLDEVLGEKAVAKLSDITTHVDIINVFRRSELLPEIAEEALKIEAPVFWSQLGVANEDAYEMLSKAGKTVIMDRCIKVEHGAMIE